MQQTREDEILVSKAFSRQSPVFDAIDESNSTITWMRNRVRAEVLRYIPRNADMLELNCGTGIDSVYFAQKGIKVFATDNAEGMLAVLNEKITRLRQDESITAQRCSFNNLEQLYGRQFDYVFSNFGGLNCTSDLDKVLSDIDVLLKPGGHFTLVIMPPVCPWEMLMVFKGYFKTAFRRLGRKGAPAHLEGVHFKCYYYKPGYIINHMRAGYKLCSLKGLSVIVPPPFIERFIEKHPRLFVWLEKIENKIWNKRPFNRWCDHFMITMQKAPADS